MNLNNFILCFDKTCLQTTDDLDLGVSAQIALYELVQNYLVK